MTAMENLGSLWNSIQSWLFPMLEDELGELDEKHREFISVCELCSPQAYVDSYRWVGNGCPPASRLALCKAFIAKAVWDFPTTRDLIDAVRHRPTLRRLCGWETLKKVPSESTFSRVFAAFAEDELPQRIQKAMIKKHYGDKIAGHISRDGTAVHGREKAAKKTPKAIRQPAKEAGPTRLQLQLQRTLDENLADLPQDCDWGTKKDSKGKKQIWRGFKLHLDAIDGDIPISWLVTSASTHDSQAAIPLAQLDMSSSVVRQIVEHEGSDLSRAQHNRQTGPDFKVEDCTEKTIITGTDGVMAPMVTEQQKLRRRKTQTVKRKKEKRKSTAKASRPRKGSDGPYKEFKIVAFYDKDKTHQYVVGTSGDHKIAGRIMRQVGQKLDISSAQRKYSVSDGAPWILRQYNTQLPMLDENILDFYHFRDHVTEASHVLFGEGNQEALAWKENMMKVVKNQGSLVMLDRLRECLAELKENEKQQELEKLREYIGKRIAMTDYPYFLTMGYDIGSGPTESFCGCLTKRLKGSGMRWDRDNAEAVMALASVYYSNQWHKYWKSKQKAA